MDPETEHEALVRITGTVEFAWDMHRALEVALFRTYAVPRISGLLARTGEFTRNPQRRYDDTMLLIAEFTEHGYSSRRGAAAIARMNELHGRHRIRNDDLLYVLSTFVFEPGRWIDAYGWRDLTDAERRAGFFFWREIADRMGIADEDGALATADTFERWSRSFEASEFRYARTNAVVGRATRDLFLQMYVPGPLRRFGQTAVHALLDDPVLDAFGFPRPTRAQRATVMGALRARARLQRRLPPRRRPVQQTQRPQRTYPDGYVIERLGPPARAPDALR